MNKPLVEFREIATVDTDTYTVKLIRLLNNYCVFIRFAIGYYGFLSVIKGVAVVNYSMFSS